MTVSILLLTHGNTQGNQAQDLLSTFQENFRPLTPLEEKIIKVVPITHDCDPGNVIPKLRHIIRGMEKMAKNDGFFLDGVLILTDIPGATPCNIARSLQDETSTRVVTGLNLSMFTKVMYHSTYMKNDRVCHLNLNELAEIAVIGGHEGIGLVDFENFKHPKVENATTQKSTKLNTKLAQQQKAEVLLYSNLL